MSSRFQRSRPWFEPFESKCQIISRIERFRSASNQTCEVNLNSIFLTPRYLCWSKVKLKNISDPKNFPSKRLILSIASCLTSWEIHWTNSSFSNSFFFIKRNIISTLKHQMLSWFLIHWSLAYLVTSFAMFDLSVSGKAPKNSLERASPNNIDETWVQYCHRGCSWWMVT